MNRICATLTVSASPEYTICDIQTEIIPIEAAAPGSVLSIMYLLPSLSITKVATRLPNACVTAKGIFKITPNYSLSEMPSIVKPVLMIT